MKLPESSTDIATTLAKARLKLLQLKKLDQGWEGELASSALATAVAVFALDLGRRKATTGGPLGEIPSDLIAKGREWLTRHQNADGGWGDTPESPSNVSTTVLACSALSSGGESRRYSESERRAEEWLSQVAGGPGPKRLAEVVSRRYANDRTFSAPILTLCALAGRLGKRPTAWKHVQPLPFELAGFPQAWFRWLRFPVVSYALPALIAIGQVRHHFLPSRNPISRLIRQLSCDSTSRLLDRIQPASGGFLEAIPLTAFVLMSLLATDQISHPVVPRGIRFLISRNRPDGSWPIDTNLETWVSTLSINALALRTGFLESWAQEERKSLVQWLLDQQFRTKHLYTGANAGGWSWTPLPGGVPDADDTAGALLALRRLGLSRQQATRCVVPGVCWLTELANRDGGIPTFCRGWGKLDFDRSSPDITAHALRALTAWEDHLPGWLQLRARETVRRGIGFLIRSQCPDGSWIPLWFGNQHAPAEENPLYGTSRVVLALQRIKECHRPEAQAALKAGITWILQARSSEGGWGGFPASPCSIEETAVAVEALAACYGALQPKDCSRNSRRRMRKVALEGAHWLVRETQEGTKFAPSPIGLYFAKLFYSEQLYPLIFTVAALERIQRFRLLD